MAKKQNSKNEIIDNSKTPSQSNGSNGQDAIKQGAIKFNKKNLLVILKLMITARTIDNKAMNLLRQGKTFFHIAGSGHEAIQAALGLYLDSKKDWLFPYYRDLAFVLSAGLTPREFFLQCFAKADDPSSGGRQLPEHWGHNDFNLPSQSSPTGTQFLQAVGVALAAKKTGKDYITYVSSGEGTTSEGEFHEAINWASREKLPVLFVIENNKYAISVHVKHQSGGKDSSIAEMVGGFSNLYRARIDGTGFFTCYEEIGKAIEYIKDGKGPALIEADVVRLLSHSSSDDQKKYREEKELNEDNKKCPIQQLSTKMIESYGVTKEEIDSIWKEVIEEINTVADEAAKMADPNPDEAPRFIFDESGLNDNVASESNEPNEKKIIMVYEKKQPIKEKTKHNEKKKM